VAIGSDALLLNTAGIDNVAVGRVAMASNTTGNNNTALGYSALNDNTIGDGNTAVGFVSMQFNTTAEQNVAVGWAALGLQSYANAGATYSSNNTAVGAFALYSNQPTLVTNGVNNTALGYSSGYNNSLGYENTFLGASAGSDNTSGFANTFAGYNSGGGTTTGDYNAAFGTLALLDNTTGSYNTAAGRRALENTTASTFNTATGYSAGDSYDNGDQNTFVGSHADANAAAYTQSTALGYNTVITASNQVRIGTAATSIGGPQNWTNTSDARIKSNVTEDVKGLEFIMKLRPVNYNVTQAAIDRIIHPEGTNTVDDLAQRPSNTQAFDAMRHTGFIAQEVEAAAQSVGFDFSGVDGPKNERDLYGLRYAEFVVPLVKGMQEQQQVIQKLQTQVEALLQRIEELEAR
jgi:hypothetical protein